MHRIFQPGRLTERQPAWLRLIALMCVLLISIASTAEVCHTHTVTAAAKKDSRQNAPGSNVPGPDHCPLCVAMHTAMPTSLTTAFGPALHAQPVALHAVAADRAPRWSYDLFSRPPPALSSVL